MRSLTLLSSLAALATAALAASAQVVRGDVRDSATDAPIVASLVLAYDSAGSAVAGAFSDDSGRFALRLGTAGRYSLRAERIGYAADTLQRVEVAAGETVVAHLRSLSIPIRLPATRVSGESKCVVRPMSGEVTAALWTEARKALYAAQIGERRRMVFAIRRRYERSVDGITLALQWEKAHVDTVVLERPWATPATPEDLARNGYGVIDAEGDSALTGPDADVLLSDAFARTHCFDLRRDPEKHAGLVGLSFVPAIKRHEAEVAGVIWLDSATARLRTVEFRHTNLFPQVSPTKYGGRIEFAQLPGGVWIVRSWVIRIPIMGSGAPIGDPRLMTGGPHVARYHDDGAEVLQATVVAVPPDG